MFSGYYNQVQSNAYTFEFSSTMERGWLHSLFHSDMLCSDIHISCARFCTWIGMTIMEENLHRLISFRSPFLLTGPIILVNSCLLLCFSSIISCIYSFNLIGSFGSGSGETTSHLPIWVLVGTITWTWFQRSPFPHLDMVLLVSQAIYLSSDMLITSIF